MPRTVTAAERANAIRLMVEMEMGQRDIEKETGLSRPYLRKLAREIGYQFPRNGVEVLGSMCMCYNCGCLFRRPKSKVQRAQHQFCDELCKQAFMKGPNHPAWKTGKTAATFSQWAKNQAAYQDFREAVLARDGYACAVSGRTDNLQVHHIMPKAEDFNPEKAFDPNNGITLNVEIHDRIHEVIRGGASFEEAVEIIKKEYNQ